MNIHFIERLRNVHPIARGSNIYTSGDWTVSIDKAAKLIGGMIYLHESQTEPSYFGGTITEFQLIPAGTENAGKIIFTFERKEEAIGVRTSRDGWGNEQKTDNEGDA